MGAVMKLTELDNFTDYFLSAMQARAVVDSKCEIKFIGKAAESILMQSPRIAEKSAYAIIAQLERDNP